MLILEPLKKSPCLKCPEKAEVLKMVEKHEVMVRHATTKYKHTHTAFVEALNKELAENLFKVQDVQDLKDPEMVSSTWVKHL